MLKIRLRRTGAKFQPTYRIVVADSRAPRDGAFVAILGFYNPRSEPATVQVDEAAVREWIGKGAQPTDSILSLFHHKGIATDVMARFSARTIGAGGKRGANQAPAAETPVVETPRAATPAPAAATTAAPAPAAEAPAATTAPTTAPVATDAPDNAAPAETADAEAAAPDAAPATTEG
jgi:small subunit ribosomal protein S16